jgi:hypothetical protein
MSAQKPDLPFATAAMEAHVKEVFPTDIDPEVFAANDGAGWLNFTFNDYRFQDEKLDQWIHTVGAIIRDPARLEEVQRKYLSTAEQMQMKKYMEDDLEEEDA